jgi:hypothetical protein
LINEKLKGFGPLYIINLARRTDRKQIAIKNLKDYGVENYTFIDAIDAEKDDLSKMFIGGKDATSSEIACTLSHLKAIKTWLDNSNTKYAIIMEDDFSFETVEYWNQDWGNFLNSINSEYDILQLCIINYNLKFNLHTRLEDDFSACVYLIKRDFAKFMIDKIFNGDICVFPEKPLADAYLYEFGKTLSIPLFTYMVETPSDISAKHRSMFDNIRNNTLNYWRKNSKLTKI